MEIFIASENKFLSDAEFKGRYPLTSFPPVLTGELLASFGAVLVLEAPPPAVGQYQTAVRNGVIKDALDNWVYAWRIDDWSPEHIAAQKASARTAKWEAIKIERDRRAAGGVLVEGNWFHTDAESRWKYFGLVVTGKSIPVGLQWKTMARNQDGSPVFVTMTRDLANQVFLAVQGHEQAAFDNAEAHRVALEAAADPAAYSFAGGWPAIYQG